MNNIDLIIDIIEFIVCIIFLFKLFCTTAKSFKLKGVFLLILSLWIMYELSEIEVAFGLDALDIIFILVLFIFIVWASKPFMEQDLLIREADKIIEKLNDKNYNPTEEELNRQMGFLSEQEKQDIKKQYIFDNIKILLNIILVIVIFTAISLLVSYFIFSAIDTIHILGIFVLLAYISMYIVIIKGILKGLNSENETMRKAVKKDLPLVISVLLLGLVGVGLFFYVFFGLYQMHP